MLSFSKGDLIYTSKPLVHLLNQKLRENRCDFCFKSTENLQRCAKCKYPYYCGRECQSRAWKWYHKPECIFLQNRGTQGFPTQSIIYFARSFLIVQRFGELEKDIIYGHVRSFRDLKSHVEEISQDASRMKQFGHILAQLKPLLPTGATQQVLLDLFGKVVINSFSICDNEMKPIGSGLYLGPSILNHSCAPEAVAVFEGTTLFLRALRDIKVEDISKVHISYLDQLDTKHHRQKALQEQYYFTCVCHLCNTQIDPEIDEHLESQVLSILPKEDQDIEWDDSLLKQCQLYSKKLPLKSPLHARVLGLAMDCAINLGQWTNVLEVGEEYLTSCRPYYGTVHPSISILCAKLGKVSLLLGDHHKAERYLDEAYKVAKFCYGPSHSFTREVEKLLEEKNLLGLELTMSSPLSSGGEKGLDC